MLILLFGQDTFRLKRKQKEIIAQHKDKHKSGLNLSYFENPNLNFDKFKQTVEAVSMFDEKKLIILNNILKDKILREDFLDYFKKSKLKQKQEIIILLCEEGKLELPSFKRKVNMYEEFKLLNGLNLINWIREEIKNNNGQINQIAIAKLISYTGGNLWQLNNEINKLVNYKNGELINQEDVDILVKHKLDSNIFKTLDALAQKDKKTALRLLHNHLEQGENEIYLLAMLAFQLRNLIKLKDLTEKNTPYNLLAKKSGLHPFIIKKSTAQLRNFTLAQLKKIYQQLAEIDYKLKTGKIDPQTALDLVVMEM